MADVGVPLFPSLRHPQPHADQTTPNPEPLPRQPAPHVTPEPTTRTGLGLYRPSSFYNPHHPAPDPSNDDDEAASDTGSYRSRASAPSVLPTSRWTGSQYFRLGKDQGEDVERPRSAPGVMAVTQERFEELRVGSPLEGDVLVVEGSWAGALPDVQDKTLGRYAGDISRNRSDSAPPFAGDDLEWKDGAGVSSGAGLTVPLQYDSSLPSSATLLNTSTGPSPTPTFVDLINTNPNSTRETPDSHPASDSNDKPQSIKTTPNVKASKKHGRLGAKERKKMSMRNMRERGKKLEINGEEARGGEQGRGIMVDELPSLSSDLSFPTPESAYDSRYSSTSSDAQVVSANDTSKIVQNQTTTSTAPTTIHDQATPDPEQEVDGANTLERARINYTYNELSDTHWYYTTEQPHFKTFKTRFFARRFIPQGKIFMWERMFTCLPGDLKGLEERHAYQAIPKDLRPQFERLPDNTKGIGFWRGRLLSNSFVSEGKYDYSGRRARCVFEKMGRVPRSCQWNARVLMDPKEQAGYLLALHDIPADTEIFIRWDEYFNSEIPLDFKPYHFTCSCSICAFPNKPANKHIREQRLIFIKLFNDVMVGQLGAADPLSQLCRIEDAIEIAMKQGYRESLEMVYAAGWSLAAQCCAEDCILAWAAGIRDLSLLFMGETLGERRDIKKTLESYTEGNVDEWGLLGQFKIRGPNSEIVKPIFDKFSWEDYEEIRRSRSPDDPIRPVIVAVNPATGLLPDLTLDELAAFIDGDAEEKEKEMESKAKAKS
ncbi:hypothetical protein B9479_007562 [Cryptococcus floricola]|uniref:SET domain-containing protein n=1 Tax=Cryptococcus floricola TaxID=2591691 RepID=A0A5D3ALM2_9TREE|nr:hypothetical protein B9479_007562 [Cryptococcus floricola]